ncbi:hypothetical protein LR48_Vigan01g133700 [Vigna angularis]|uniref:BOI-related E3 ubiquitin-protein ligase 3 n=1 Tax=Phaseolus angularis TaxID=3914 RepID=A0A0L9TMV0_PHAAN|nr:hypothetical protein LR48_Vigan01g133700 [Vigna angularis]
MAVEAQHMNLFPAQLLTAREMPKPNRAFYNAQTEGGVALPSTVLPFHHTTLCDPNSINKSDSGLTYNIPLPRKRSRDSVTESNVAPPASNKIKLSSFDQDLVFHFQNQQSEIDRFIAQHTQSVWMELEEQRVRQSRMLVKAIQEAVAKKLKEKDEEIQRLGKLNWVLQERVKSLSVENQIWRELAQNNEATANSLRNNLEEVLAHVSEENRNHGGVAPAESSCGSNNRGTEEVEENEVCGNIKQNDGVVGRRRMCSECGGTGQWWCVFGHQQKWAWIPETGMNWR